MKDLSKLKVAIVCDWLVNVGGAERVVLALHEMFPDAPIYTSQYDPKKINWFKDADVRTTWLQKLPKFLRKFLPVFRAWTFSHLDLNDYDLVISSSGAEAKGVKTGPNTIHICYCHSPTHYYWVRFDEYLAQPGFGLLNPLAKIGLKLLVGPMRRWDFKAAQRPNYLIANSSYTQKNIKKFYKRDSEVIHPPVDIDRFKVKNTHHRSGFVITGRQTPYKRIDLVVEACKELNVPLVVIGNGPDHNKLVKAAGPKTTFLTNANDQDVANHLNSAEAFIFPNADDFGISAVEALASGTPVIAYKDGGSKDYIIEKKNGLFFDKQNVASLINAIETSLTIKFNNDFIKQSAEKFSDIQFKNNVKEFITRFI